MKLKMLLASFFVAAAILFTPSFNEGKAEASTINPNDLVNTAAKYQGIRYSYGGTTTAGFDCSGYVQFIYKQFGITLPRSSSAMYASGTSVAMNDLKAGDLVFFKTTAAQVGHVGIYVGYGQFIHSATSKGVMISSLYDPYYWGNRYVGAKRIANVTN